MRLSITFVLPLAALLSSCAHAQAARGGAASGGAARDTAARPRARALGIAPGIFRPGAANAITDVAGVQVGHATRVAGDSVRTGVTAILPHRDNPYLERVPAAVWVGNGFGKLVGISQLRELGELESPILLTCTLCTWKAADALAEWLLAQPRMERVRSVNVVVGETNDGRLNAAIRSRPIDAAAVREALAAAASGPVAEGSIGAGAGTVAFGWKGGIGTSSRVLPKTLGGYTVGVLVQSNFGGVLQVMGAPVGRELGQYAFKADVEAERACPEPCTTRPAGRDDADRRGGDGSIMMVVATDAPLSDRNLERLASRAIMGLSRTGSAASNGSGDYVIAFSTSPLVRRHFGPGGVALTDSSRTRTTAELTNDDMSALFQGVVEATEEAIYNSLTTATTVTAREGTVEALPIGRLVEVLRKYGVVR